VHTPRTNQLARGVNRYGRARVAHFAGRWLHMKKGAARKEEKKGEVKLEKKEKKEALFYAADDVSKPLFSRKSRHHPTKLRKNITPGTVLILLAGKFMGKRVVFLKQLASGLLLVTGPYALNGVPLRRVNQAYVISTATKVDVKDVEVKNIDDAFFKREQKKEAKKADQKAFLEEKKEKKSETSAVRKAEQKRVDGLLLPVIAKTPQLKTYLKGRFTLTAGMYPHAVQGWHRRNCHWLGRVRHRHEPLHLVRLLPIRRKEGGDCDSSREEDPP